MTPPWCYSASVSGSKACNTLAGEFMIPVQLRSFTILLFALIVFLRDSLIAAFSETRISLLSMNFSEWKYSSFQVSHTKRHYALLRYRRSNPKSLARYRSSTLPVLGWSWETCSCITTNTSTAFFLCTDYGDSWSSLGWWVSLRDLLDDPGLIHFACYTRSELCNLCFDTQRVWENLLRLLRKSAVSRTDPATMYDNKMTVWLHFFLKTRFTQGLLVLVVVMLWATHGLRAYGPSVPWVSLPGPNSVPQSQGFSVAKRQPFLIWLLVVLESWHHVCLALVRGRVSRSCATENTYKYSRARWTAAWSVTFMKKLHTAVFTRSFKSSVELRT